MKRFAFISGNKADASRGMQLVVDRSRVPAGMKLGLWLDDDGKAFPNLARPALRRAVDAGCGEFVLLDRTRIRARLCGFDGVLTVEPGTRFDAGLGEDVVPAEVRGGDVLSREGRRFAELRDPRSTIAIDKRPNDVHVFTLEAEAPPNAKAGERFRVDVVQKDATGTVVGGLTVLFAFD